VEERARGHPRARGSMLARPRGPCVQTLTATLRELEREDVGAASPVVKSSLRDEVPPPSPDGGRRVGTDCAVPARTVRGDADADAPLAPPSPTTPPALPLRSMVALADRRADAGDVKLRGAKARPTGRGVASMAAERLERDSRTGTSSGSALASASSKVSVGASVIVIMFAARSRPVRSSSASRRIWLSRSCSTVRRSRRARATTCAASRISLACLSRSRWLSLQTGDARRYMYV
jgi:hypothetical protein